MVSQKGNAPRSKNIMCAIRLVNLNHMWSYVRRSLSSVLLTLKKDQFKFKYEADMKNHAHILLMHAISPRIRLPRKPCSLDCSYVKDTYHPILRLVIEPQSTKSWNLGPRKIQFKSIETFVISVNRVKLTILCRLVGAIMGTPADVVKARVMNQPTDRFLHSFTINVSPRNM